MSFMRQWLCSCFYLSRQFGREQNRRTDRQERKLCGDQAALLHDHHSFFCCFFFFQPQCLQALRPFNIHFENMNKLIFLCLVEYQSALIDQLSDAVKMMLYRWNEEPCTPNIEMPENQYFACRCHPCDNHVWSNRHIRCKLIFWL